MRLLLLAVTLLSISVSVGCRGKHQEAATVQNEEPQESAPRIASAFKMNDAAAPAQLLHGFYGLESGTWRWTAGKFAVIFRPPMAGAQKGATLTFIFSAPDVLMQKVGDFTLTATSGATKLKSEKYSKAGSYTFTADVPAELLAKETLTVDFAMDKSMPGTGADHRELGLIAISTGLESK